MKTEYVIAGKDEITAQLKEIHAKFAELNSTMHESSKEAKEMNESFEKMKELAETFAVFEIAEKAVEFLKDKLHEAIEAYGEYEKATAKLAGQLRATSESAGLTVDNLKSLADEMMSTTSISDDLVISAESLMLTFDKVTGETFERGIKASANMSVVFGDIKTAAMEVGRALNDPIGGLTRLERTGIRFSEAQKEQMKNFVEHGQLMKAQEIILDELESKFGGVAETVGNTASASFDRLKNSSEDFFKTLGRGMTDFLAPFNKALSEQLNFETANNNLLHLTEHSKEFYEIFGKIQEISGRSHGFDLPGMEEQIRKLQSLGMDPRYVEENTKIALEHYKNLWREAILPWEKDKWAGIVQFYENQLDLINDAVLAESKIGEEKKKQAQIDAQNRVNDEIAEEKKLKQLELQKELNKLALEKWKQEAEALENKYTKLNDLEQVQHDIAEIEKKWREATQAATKQKLSEALAGAELKEAEIKARGTAADLVEKEVEAEEKRKKILSDLLQLQKDETKSAAELAAIKALITQYERQEKKDEKANFDPEKSIAGMGEFGSMGSAVYDALTNKTEDNLTKTFNLLNTGWSTATSIMQKYYQDQNDASAAALAKQRSNLALEDSWERAKEAQAHARGKATLQMEADYASQKAQREQELSDKEAELKRKQWQANHDMSLSTAEMQGAQAFVAALTVPPPMGEILATFIGGLALAEIGKIANEEMPQFADGGLVFPNGDTRGRAVRVAETEPEWILNGKQMNNLLSSRQQTGTQTNLHFPNASFIGAPTSDAVRVWTDAIKKEIRRNKISPSYADW